MSGNNKTPLKTDAGLGAFYGRYILALLLMGTNGVVAAQISLFSSQIVLMRTFIGGVALTAIVLLRGGFSLENLKSELFDLLLGGIALGMNWITLFGAYRLLNVSLATLIYYIGPMLVLLLSPWLFGERLTGPKIAAIAIVFVGLLFISGSIAAEGLSMTGLLYAVASALFYAVLLVFNKRIKRTSGLQTAAIEIDVAFVVVLIDTLLTVGLPHPLASDIPYLLTIGLINTGLAYMLYFSGLQKLPAQSVALISYVDPVSAVFFSSLFLYEKLTVFQIVGAVFIIGGAMIGEYKRKGAGASKSRLRRESV
ncbi:MAG: DMT family transporter [Clostridia bacterium]|jgi:drug/metabolite transporter (DMT)-like permease|nr:DMT family transporter [Clostridia bacterium]